MPGDRRAGHASDPAADRVSATRVAVVGLASVAAAVGLGVAARYAAGSGLIAFAGPVAEPASRLGSWVIALGAPWLAVAWLLGVLSRRTGLGAAAGAFALVGGTGAWYAFTVWSEGRASLGYAVPVSIGWAAAAAVAGAVFGAGGALWRSGRGDGARALGAAMLAAPLIGEAVLLETVWDGRAARVVLTVELLIGLVLPFVLVRRPPRALLLCVVLTAVLSVVAAGAEDVVRDALRNVGWAGR
ncbi:MAG TPA: DUF6518 family protein [Solirubrobacter sp.]|nr:DUF6518 family protein [Solirubrobacter sp.]